MDNNNNAETNNSENYHRVLSSLLGQENNVEQQAELE